MIYFDQISINSSLFIDQEHTNSQNISPIFFLQKMTLASLWRLQDLVRLLSKGAGYNAED